MSHHPLTSSPLAHVRVGDCMHRGILSCPPDATLGEVAEMMARHRIHAVAVTEPGSAEPTGIVSDLDVVAAVAAGDDPDALHAAATEPLAVSADDSLARAAQLMSEHGVSHLVVIDAASGRPVGVLSTLDIAAAYAG